MNTYLISKAFFEKIYDIPEAKPPDIALFFYIIDLANRLGWPKHVPLKTDVTLASIKVGNRKTLKRSLENLNNWRIIEIISWAKNQYDATNIVRIKCFDIKAKALSKAVQMQSQNTAESLPIYINNKLLNFKPLNNMDILLKIFEPEKVEKLSKENIKHIERNLNLILQKNFHEIAFHDLNNSNFSLQIQENEHKKKENILATIYEFFGINELNNFRLFAITEEFVDFLMNTSQIKSFEENFFYYTKYKELTNEKLHGFPKFIGTPDQNYENGIWKSENYKTKIKRLENNQGITKMTVVKDNLDEGKENLRKRLLNG